MTSKGDDILAAARRVLDMEAAGLAKLARSLDDSLVRAVELVHAATGRVAVTGMGKSGHIARKISSTMSSTGTPAHYVHPGEASHGDLGMITRDDVVLALSNSGDTAELSDIVGYTRRFEIPLVAITSGTGSMLAKQADITLALPDVAEACSLELAPTTSTTMMLALGDALAVALLDRRGFSAQDFHALHPGGRLGQMLVRVGDIMHVGDDVPTIGVASTMGDALLEMTAKSFGCVGVLGDNGKLEGIITDGDIRRNMGDRLTALKTSDVMTAGPATANADMLAAQALGIMNDRSITSLFVTEDGTPVGILHIHDCLRAGLS